MTKKQVLSVDNGETAQSGSVGISILVVDCNSTCLTIVSKMLLKFGYKVITAKRTTDALRILRERQQDLDLILTEIHLPDMDKYELLETMGQLSCLPIVVLSADTNENAILGCLFKGAMFYLVKPITPHDIKNLWQFSYVKKHEEGVQTEGAMSFRGKSPPDNVSNEPSECLSFLDSGEQSVRKGKRKASEEIDGNKEEDNASSKVSKKPKLIWTNELHERFLQAIRLLGLDSALPKKILKHMNVPGLKKENISSHLQKYRLSLRREQEAIQKTMLRDYQLSSFDLQCENFEYLKPQFLITNSEPEFRSHAQNPKYVNGSICMPSLGGAKFPINLCSNHNDMSIPKYNDQEYSTYTSCSVVGITVNDNEDLGSLCHMESENGEEISKHSTTVYSLGNSGFERTTDGIEVLGNSSEQQQQLSPPPLLWEQVEDILGAERDELFDIANSSQMFLEEEDLW
ncbi:hypothetical protein JCGZ_14467 [Jatropha curcas]|uniref:Uncharacterized protein n=1 Tax=Jatropha curcas TaxID=180498 RepID=A0A067JXK6_JATCU|nr:hypothetical protein JCGZ_14467 [Jatropha curcas]